MKSSLLTSAFVQLDATPSEEFQQAEDVEGEGLLKCIELAPQEEVQRRTQDFCLKFGPPGTELSAICLSMADEAQALMQKAVDSCRGPKTGDCFLRKLRLPLTHPIITRKVEGQVEPQVDPLPLPVITAEQMHFNSRWEILRQAMRNFITDFPTFSGVVKEVRNEIKQLDREAIMIYDEEENDRLFWVRPHVEPMLVRLILQTLSFNKCTNLRVQPLGFDEKFNEKHLRSHTLGVFFAEALALRECIGWRTNNNCETLKYYARMSKTVTKYFLSLNETTGPITSDTKFYAGRELEYAFDDESDAVQDLIEGETQSTASFILEGADKVSTRVLNFVGRSRVGRALIASVVSRILRFADALRREKGAEGEEPDPAQNKLLRSKILLEATAKIESIVFEMTTYYMSGKKPLALVHKHVIQKVLLRELQRAAKKREPRRSLGQRFKKFFRFGRGRSSLQVENTSVLMPVDAHETMVKSASRWTPRRMEASLLQSDKDKGFKKRNVYLLAGGTFIFLGIAVLSSVATGALGLGLIVAGIVALLIPIVGKLVDVITGTIRRSRSTRPTILALPAPPPREPEEPQPLEGLREPEEDQAPPEADALTEAGPEEEPDQLKNLQIEEVD
ncbi:hypothetical protein Emag_003731 [Eimeria magna]